MKLKHGGKRSNAGRLPNFGEKLQETKAIYINVPKDNHEALMKICKSEIKRYLESLLIK
jgi:hypothetical protein